MKTFSSILLCCLFVLSGCGIETTIRKSKIVDSKLPEKCIYLNTQKKYLGFMTSVKLLSYLVTLQKGDNDISLDQIVKNSDMYLKKINCDFVLRDNNYDLHPECSKYSDVFDFIYDTPECKGRQLTQAKQIVCIDPLVVIVFPANVYNIDKNIILYSDENKMYANVKINNDWHRFSETPRHESGSYKPDFGIDFFDLNTATVLHSGYIVDDTIAHSSDNLMWFSPDLDIKPEPLVIDKNRIGRISTTEGNIILTKEENGWSVKIE